jgi:hypothetical protein
LTSIEWSSLSNDKLKLIEFDIPLVIL